MRIVISNELEITDPMKELEAWILSKEIENPERDAMKRLGKYYLNIPKTIKMYYHNRFTNTFFLPRGYLKELIEKFPDFDIYLEDNTTNGEFIELGNPRIVLRDYQKEGYEKATREYGGVIVAPAGSGKTVLGISLISKFKRKTVWLCHSNDLLQQAVETYFNTFPEELNNDNSIGTISGGKYELHEDNKVIFALVQSLQNNTNVITSLLKDVGLVILDEAHHVPSETFSRVIKQFKAKTLIGLTATPERKDGLTELIEAFIGPEIIAVDRADLYLNNKLIIPKLVPVYTDFFSNLSFDSQDSGYHAITGELYNDYNRAVLCANYILEYSKFGLVIVLSDNIKYAHKVKSLLESNAKKTGKKVELIHGGISQYKTIKCTRGKYNLMIMQGLPVSRYVDGKTKLRQYTDEEYAQIKCNKAKREKVIEEAKQGKIDILFATKLADEGLDIPIITTVALISPCKGDESGTKNGSRLEQRVGRGMRPALGKSRAFILDFVDYNSGIFKSQWYTRRRTYTRLGIQVPDKPRSISGCLQTENLFNDFEI